MLGQLKNKLLLFFLLSAISCHGISDNDIARDIDDFFIVQHTSNKQLCLAFQFWSYHIAHKTINDQQHIGHDQFKQQLLQNVDIVEPMMLGLDNIITASHLSYDYLIELGSQLSPEIAADSFSKGAFYQCLCNINNWIEPSRNISFVIESSVFINDCSNKFTI